MNVKSGFRGAWARGLLVALAPTIALGGLSAPRYADWGNAGVHLAHAAQLEGPFLEEENVLGPGDPAVLLALEAP